MARGVFVLRGNALQVCPVVQPETNVDVAMHLAKRRIPYFATELVR